MAKFMIRVFCLLVFFAGVITSNGHANIQYSEYRESREAALTQIKNGKTKLGLIRLVKLSEKGDGVSSHALGLFYLRAPQVVRLDVDNAVRLFALGASQCYAPSLKVLKKNFYGNKASEYFDLKKLAVIDASCNKKQKLETEKRKEAEEQRRAEIEKETEEEKRKAEVESQSVHKNGDENLVSAKVVFAWSKILPKFSAPTFGGSGFAISEDGYFLTNHHVAMSEGCNHLAVSYNNLKGVGKTLAYDESLDLALVKVDAPTPYFTRFDLSKFRPGEKLVAIGYPLSPIFGNTPSVSEGVLMNASDTKTGFRVDGMLLISVPITQGNSGGPVLSGEKGLRGVVVGGWSTDVAEKVMEEDYGGIANLSSVNLNLMVSGARAYEWIKQNAKFVQTKVIANTQNRFDTDKIAEAGIKTLADITCYKE